MTVASMEASKRDLTAGSLTNEVPIVVIDFGGDRTLAVRCRAMIDDKHDGTTWHQRQQQPMMNSA
jgi:hypothetical protein